MKILLVLAALFTLGCSTVASSVNYTSGTQALEAGDTTQAIHKLERAVELDPSLARNQNNLAAAYFEAGRILDGWPHVRRAVMLEPMDQIYRANFQRFVSSLIRDKTIETGMTEDQVRAAIGDPDGMKVVEPCSYWQYAAIALCFKGGRLDGIADMGRSK